MLRSVRSFAKQFAASVLVLSAGLSLSAHAQRAPELLPAQVKLIAGSGTTAVASGGTCPVSGNIATDAYGDGCLATEVLLGTSATAPGPRYAVADANGNVFFTDYANYLVRRVDAITGIITTVAGGATATPAIGVACGTLTSVDAIGDGCLGTSIKLAQHPMGIALNPLTGDLYFSDSDFSTSGTTGGAHIRKIAATSGFITTTGAVSLVLGQASGAKGYAADISTTCTATVSTGCITAANSYLFLPYQISFDSKGNLYWADEYTKNAVLVYNTTSGFETINNVAVPAGTVAKVFGGYGTTATVPDCPNSPATTNGCSYGKTTFGGQATSTIEDGVYAAAPDLLGNLYADVEYYNFIGKIASTGVITQWAGVQASTSNAVVTRGTVGTQNIGSSFGITTDTFNNVYYSDAVNGALWRVDADTQTQYIVAGAGTVCSTGDAYGNGCAATQATFGKSGTSYASGTLPGPGVYGVSVDTYGNLFTGDTETNEVREVGTGAQFGAIGNTQPTNTLIVHYAPTDGPASSTPYVITTGVNNFAVGTPGTCTVNADTSQDCLVPIQATPSILGPFTGTLTVTSKLGKTAAFPLSGTYVTSRVTRTTVALSASGAATCTGTIYSSSTTITLTATISSTGTPTGTVQFYNGTTAIGSPVAVSGGTASLSQTFPVGSYSITAKYSGDTNFNTSTSATPVTFSTQNPSFSFAAVAVTGTPNVVTAGGTALYSFTVPTTLYSGSISFSCAGLPAGASCVFSPSVLTGTGCSLTGTSALVVAMSIFTTAAPTTISAGFTGGRWMMISGFFLALLVGFGRRRLPIRFAQLSVALALLLGVSGVTACSSSTIGARTPAGSYTVTVTAADNSGSVQTVPVNLTVK